MINKIIKSVNKQWVDILSSKAINWVEKFLNKYVESEQFYKDYPKAEKLAKLDKTKQVKNNFKWKEERISKFIEKLNPVEYKEIIEWLKGRIENRVKKNEDSNNNNFNILNTK